MFKWLGLFLFCVEAVNVCSQTIRYAEKRVINSPGIDYASYQQHFATHPPSPGLSAYSEFSQKMPQPTPFNGELPKNIRTIIVTKRVPVPYPVHVEKQIPFPVKFPIRRPYTVYVPRPYVVEVMKQVPVPVKVPYPQPYTVEKHVPVPYKVHYDKPYPVHVAKPYPVYYEKRIPIHIEKPVPVPYKVAVDRPVPVHLPLEKPVLYPVERPWPFPIKVPFEKPVPSHLEKPIPVPVTVEKPQLATGYEQSLTESYYTSTRPPVHNTFSPSPYDELTSSLITEGKHKVISFLPGSQNNLGSYGDHSEVQPIHVTDFKGSAGNSTDWVPKSYIPNSQYLTYIPNTRPNHLQYVAPEQTTKLIVNNNDEQNVVKPNSFKMHYKLHYDPAKQEYSFQLVPKAPGTDSGGHVGYSYQSIKSEGKQLSNSPTDPQAEYTYQPVQEAHTGREPQDSPKNTHNSETFNYQQIVNGKNKVPTYHQSADSQALTYSYPSQNQHSVQYKQEEPLSYETINTENNPNFEGGNQASDQQPQVTYTYESVQDNSQGQNFRAQPLSNDQHQISYSYQAVHNDAKAGFEVNHQLKPNQVSYMYVPQEPAGGSYSEVSSNSDSVPTYSISHDQNDLNTEYPQILYQRGKVSTILRDQYVTDQSLVGSIPEHFKSSRKSESTPLYQVENANGSSAITHNEQQQLGYDGSNTKYHVINVHPSPHNQTAEGGATSSITFQKFGVDDVMSHRRTRLYPVNDSFNQELLHSEHKKLETTAANYDLMNGNYFQAGESTTPTTENHSNSKVYRLSPYTITKSNRDQEPTVRNEGAKTVEENTNSYYEESDKTPDLQWYEFFGSGDSDERETSDLDTNSHTGAAERAPFYDSSSTYGYTSFTATTTSSSLQPPEDSITAKPTESMKIRNRGLVKAFGRRKEVEPTTEGYLPGSSTKGTRRRRRPARRRMDKVTEAPVEEAES